MTSSQATLVGVVVPAYNAAATLDQTLRSVRAQTHRALEIVVVDDGSHDGTAELAQRHAAEDERVRVLRQANAGVAAARNAGWQASQAELIAFIDADDLWAPTKIERQLQALMQAGPRAGLVYCWTARIDGDGKVFMLPQGRRHEGDVLQEIARSNFVGSGSAALIRRQALIDAGGFEPRLRAAGAEGCEDWLLYCRVAEQYSFALAPEYLVGYRYTAGNMSSDRPRMFRSHMMMCDEMLKRNATLHAPLTGGLRNYGVWLLRDALSIRHYRQVLPLWIMLLRRYPTTAVHMLLKDVPMAPLRTVRNALRGLLGSTGKPGDVSLGQPFLTE
jgi:glycosyltransferase involved in cell wall biosynthesis